MKIQTTNPVPHDTLNSACQAALDKKIILTADYFLLRDFFIFDPSLNENDGFYILLLFAALRSGSLCLNIDKGKQSQVEQLLLTIDKSYANLKKQTLNKSILVESVCNAKQFMQQEEQTKSSKPIIFYKNQYLYFQKVFCSKYLVDTMFESRFKFEHNHRLTSEKIKSTISEIFTKRPIIKSNSAMIFDKDQIQGVESACSRPVTILSGGPGSGKTSVIVNMIRALLFNGVEHHQITLLAPTGRAVHRMTESIRENLTSVKDITQEEKMFLSADAMTIHRFLIRCSKGESNSKAVIVDEISMIDIFLMKKLLEAVPQDANLIFVGDRNQLPPVDAGAAFNDVLIHFEHHPESFIFLNRTYRSSKEINEISESIRNNSLTSSPFPVYNPLQDTNKTPPLGVARIESKNSYGHLKKILEWVAQQNYTQMQSDLLALKEENAPEGLSESLLNTIKNLLSQSTKSRVLCLTWMGLTGATNANNIMQTYLRQLYNATGDLFSGVPVMVTQNDYTSELFNGDLGLYLSFKNGDYLVFPSEDSVKFYIPDFIPFEISYAITVHKSQGSEYENILLLLPEQSGPLHTKELFYTGLTRAKKSVLIYGNEPVLQECIKRKAVRESGQNLILT